MIEPPTFPAAWNVSRPTLIAETFSSRIWRVERDDGSPAVVKALKEFDDVEDELRGAHLLRWRDGVGMVRLLAVDGRDMLIEYADGPLLGAEIDVRGDTWATQVAAEVMAALHSASERPAPPDLQPLTDRYAALFDKAKADRYGGIESLYTIAANVAATLLGGQRDVRPLHGDLHHENIVHSARGWLAIDPKGVIGDPCFDAANLFYNPLDRDDLCSDEDRIATLATIFAKTTRRSERTILDHAFAYGCLSAAWHAGDGNLQDEARELTIARNVRSVSLRS